MNIVVIGAARGLGRCLSERLAAQGHHVIGGFFHKSEEVSRALKEAGVNPIHMDVSDEEVIKEAVKKIEAEMGSVDAVVHTAGVLLKSDRTETLMTASVEDFMSALLINAAGIMIAFRNIYPLMKKNGIYLAVTSEGGSFSNEGSMFPGYGVSKTAANKVVQTLRCTVDDVRILAVHPGRMNTDMGRTTAQIEPEEAAEGFIKILNGAIEVDESRHWFIDYKGNDMPL